MKNSVYLFVILLASCNFKPAVKEAPATDSLTIVLDTLMINNETYFLDSINKNEFESVYKHLSELYEYPYDSIEIIDDSIHVSRNNGTLTFHLRNGADSILTDTPCVTDDTVYNDLCERYEYVKSYDIIDYWLVKVSFWEDEGYMLVNKKDGVYKGLLGMPIFSPDKNYFISYSGNFMCVDNSGIQLFEIKNKKVKELWYKGLSDSDWVPSKIIWKDKTTLYIEQGTKNDIDYEDNSSFKYKSIKVILKK